MISPNADTFLDYSSYLSLKEKVQDVLERSLLLSRGKKLKLLEKELPFDQCFSTKGVQGIAGLLKYIVTPASSKKVQLTKTKSKIVKTPEVSIPIVFKTSADIDWSIDHEAFVLRYLNQLRQFCPHFVGELGSIVLPVSNNFIDTERAIDNYEEDPEEEEPEENSKEPRVSIYEDDPKALPATVMLIEYVGKYNLEKICEAGLSAQAHSHMIMILAGLQIAQQVKKFVHYDLHLQNILLREVHPSSIFVYRLQTQNGIKMIMTPTHGHFPVMIDMGSSYIKDYDDKPVRTSIGNYKSGLMSTEWDPLNDIHHFLFRCIDFLEVKDPRWREIGTKLMYMFKKLPIWRYKGWKNLPVDIHKIILKKIFKYCPNICTSSFFMKYANGIIDNLSSGTKVKWTIQYPSEDDLIQPLRENLLQLAIFLDKWDAAFEDENTILFLFKEWVLFCSNNNFEKLTEWKMKMSEHIGKIPNGDWARLWECTHTLIRCITDLLARYNQNNKQLIEKAYDEIPIKEPFDMISILQRSFPNRYKILPSSEVHVWDMITKSHYITSGKALGIEVEQEILYKQHEDILNRICNLYKWNKETVSEKEEILNKFTQIKI